MFSLALLGSLLYIIIFKIAQNVGFLPLMLTFLFPTFMKLYGYSIKTDMEIVFVHIYSTEIVLCSRNHHYMIIWLQGLH